MLKEKEEIIRNLTAASEAAAMVAAEAEAELLLGPEVEAAVDTSTVLACTMLHCTVLYCTVLYRWTRARCWPSSSRSSPCC